MCSCKIKVRSIKLSKLIENEVVNPHWPEKFTDSVHFYQVILPSNQSYVWRTPVSEAVWQVFGLKLCAIHRNKRNFLWFTVHYQTFVFCRPSIGSAAFCPLVYMDCIVFFCQQFNGLGCVRTAPRIRNTFELGGWNVQLDCLSFIIKIKCRPLVFVEDSGREWFTQGVLPASNNNFLFPQS